MSTKTVRLWVVDHDSQRVDIVDVSKTDAEKYMITKDAYTSSEKADQAIQDYWAGRKEIVAENREAAARYQQARQIAERQWDVR